MIKMTVKKKTVVSSILATISGLCLVTGISLLVYEGSANEYGACKETTVHD